MGFEPGLQNLPELSGIIGGYLDELRTLTRQGLGDLEAKAPIFSSEKFSNL